MAITAAELVWKYSVNQGPGNSVAQANPNDSLGGFMSSTPWAGGALHDLFDVVSGQENAAQESEYRLVFVHNTNASLALQNARVYLSAEQAGGANVAIALDGTGPIAANSTTAQAERVANENTPPSGEAFSSPASYAASALTIPSLASGQCIGIWIRRTTTNSGPVNADNVTIRIEGDTAA